MGFFCPTSDVQLDHILHHTPKLGIPVEIVQSLLKLLLKQRFHSPFISTAKFHSFYVKESGSKILERSKLDILPPTPQTHTKNLKALLLR